MSKSAKVVLGREPINSEWLADVRFGAHSGLKSDITALPKCAKRRHSVADRATAAVGPPISPAFFALHDPLKSGLSHRWNSPSNTLRPRLEESYGGPHSAPLC